jgi:hypothetical protein
MTVAGKTAGHDNSAMNGSLVSGMYAASAAVLTTAISKQAQMELDSIAESFEHFKQSLHIGSHPSLDHRIANINEQKQLHDKGGLKR